ncbi:MAG: hypothetical protein KIT84_28720 [Labilithrix sp.]|nr:hypothetical protein [Labilithrix sp.]MCW5815044.1 hypothetical protein [Labilithrix sp.]
MGSSIFSIEVAARLDRAPDLLGVLRGAIKEQPAAIGLQHKWALYKRACDALLANLGVIERGCWDFFEEDDKAEKDFKMWLGGMTTEEGARRQPSGKADAYRGGDPRFLTFTMTLLLLRPSPTHFTLQRLCDIPEAHLWRRDVFGRILGGLGAVSFASVKSDVMYLIPRDDDWGLTVDDLRQDKFHYLRPIVG